MKQLIGKLNDLWPEHSVALSIPKEVDRSKEKLEGAWETTGIIYQERGNYISLTLVFNTSVQLYSSYISIFLISTYCIFIFIYELHSHDVLCFCILNRS